MQIVISSRFNPAQTYLSACVDGRAGTSFEVCGIESPMQQVREYYSTVLAGDFNFSFITEQGQRLFYGMPEYPARNLLMSVAYESAQYQRTPSFSVSSSELLNDWVNHPELPEALFSRPGEALPQVEAVLTEDGPIRDLSAWLYFLSQRSLFAGAFEQVSTLLRTLIAVNSSFSARVLRSLRQLDPEFLSLWAPNGSYRVLRSLATSGNGIADLCLLAAFAPVNHSFAARAQGRLQLAARSATVGSVEPTDELWTTIERALESNPTCPVPEFLPDTTKRPATVAMQVLRHFDNDLPHLEVVAEVLGTRIVPIDFPVDVLGMFVESPEVHHSAILVNRNARTLGSQRFTIAHELGHYLLHSGQGFLCGYREIYDPDREREREANEFAAELLMPTGLMRNEIRRRFGAQEIRDIARRFGVSTEAAARRIVDIDRRRQLAFVVVLDQEIISIAATVIREDGLRWVGRPSIGVQAILLAEAHRLHQSGEARLERYLPHATGEWLQDLEIDLHPFSDGNGYYLFIERTIERN